MLKIQPTCLSINPQCIMNHTRSINHLSQSRRTGTRGTRSQPVIKRHTSQPTFTTLQKGIIHKKGRPVTLPIQKM
jgi:hypothetical protein